MTKEEKQGRIKLFDLQCFVPLLTRIKNAVIIYGESPPDCAPSYDDKIAPLLKELTRTAYNKGWSDSRRRRKKRE